MCGGWQPPPPSGSGGCTGGANGSGKIPYAECSGDFIPLLYIRREKYPIFCFWEKKFVNVV